MSSAPRRKSLSKARHPPPDRIWHLCVFAGGELAIARSGAAMRAAADHLDKKILPLTRPRPHYITPCSPAWSRRVPKVAAMAAT
jgi:hypothetical protein